MARFAIAAFKQAPASTPWGTRETPIVDPDGTVYDSPAGDAEGLASTSLGREVGLPKTAPVKVRDFGTFALQNSGFAHHAANRRLAWQGALMAAVIPNFRAGAPSASQARHDHWGGQLGIKKSATGSHRKADWLSSFRK